MDQIKTTHRSWDHRDQYGFWLQHKLLTFTQYLVATQALDINTDQAAVGPGTQTWTSVVAQVQTRPWAQVALYVTHVDVSSLSHSTAF